MLETFETRFKNWVNWCKLKNINYSRTGSAEGNYKSPQIWDERNPIPEWIRAINHLDAIEVNRAYIALPEKPRQIIYILCFKSHWRAEYQAQRINCHHTELGERLYWAKTQLNNLLTNKQHYIESTHRFALSRFQPVGGLSIA